MSNIRAVLFDVDGVLLDSTAANAEFFRELFLRIGGSIPDGAVDSSNNHLPFEITLRRVYPKANDDDIKKWMAMSDDIENGAELLSSMPGVLETIPLLSKLYKLGIVTNRLRKHLPELWVHVPFRESFSAISAYEDTVEHKPHPEPILLAMNNLGVTPNETVFVGDAKSDLQAGLGAGVSVIILGQEEWPGAVATIATFSELPATLERL